MLGELAMRRIGNGMGGDAKLPEGSDSALAIILGDFSRVELQSKGSRIGVDRLRFPKFSSPVDPETVLSAAIAAENSDFLSEFCMADFRRFNVNDLDGALTRIGGAKSRASEKLSTKGGDFMSGERVLNFFVKLKERTISIALLKMDLGGA